jgi:DUF4097 and DUF4098 domain-containing protein YvlB
MRLRIHFVILAVALLCLTACDFEDMNGGFSRYSSDFHFSYPMNANGKLAVETFNGSIEVSGWDQDTIDISGTKYAPSQSEADSMNVAIEHTADSVSIRVARPTDRRGNRGARFVIKVPRKAILDRLASSNGAIRTNDGTGPSRFHTSNGQIVVHGLKGDLDAQSSNGALELMDIDGQVVGRTSNGRIRVERVRGGLQLNSSNGGVTAELARADRPVRIETSNSSVDLSLPGGFNSDVRVDTNNGGITVHVPNSLNARVVARTSNSSITSDLELKVQGEISKNHMDAVIGSGGPLIDLTTSNGGIHLVRL